MAKNTPQQSIDFKGLRSGDLTLYLIEKSDYAPLCELLRKYDEAAYFLEELEKSYLPAFNDSGWRTKYGFTVRLADDLAGLCLLGISSREHRRGYTGADILPHMRGRNIAPRSKPLLFYLAFEMLALNRVETGCLASNEASRRSIEKIKGIQYEGRLREYNRKLDGQYEDDLRYAILRRDWLELYDRSEIEVIR
ncbi:MAG: GNAT family N-acetyltransferase [candidate division Zixibacteria bacterium]|nr:GNAT family N-acetyltransferase [candidate division Zixibacteria bacterium]